MLDALWRTAAWSDTLQSWLHCVLAATALHRSAEPEIVIAEDQQDIAATLAGDGEAFARLIERYQNEVGRIMWRFTRDRGQWEALVADVLVDAYLSLANYRARGPFGAWLRTIATRAGYKFWRDRSQRREAEAFSLAKWNAAATTSADALRAADAAELVHRALEQLPPRDRLVLTLLYLEECSVAECAERTGWSRAMVKVQAHRARGKLRRLLESEADA
jgi:RNA polymerase sigma-70 factor (ECF subfamily)